MIIMNIITFGWYAYRQYKATHVKVLELESKDVANTDSLQSTELVVQDAERVIKAYSKQEPKRTLLQSYDPFDVNYLTVIHTLITTPEFEYLFFSIDQEVFDQIKTSDPEDAIALQGMAKGLEYFRKRLSDVNTQYLTTTERVNNDTL